MNDKTSNFVGYSQTVGISSRDTTVTTNCNGLINSYSNGDFLLTQINEGSNLLYGNGSEFNLKTTLINQDNMVKQVKVAVFTVERNDKNVVISTKFVKELWVEVKNGASLDLVVAKQLDKEFDPSNTVIKEIYSFTF
jgi:hypothetical protein